VLYYEKKLRKLGVDCIIGVDEVGRGCLAGPVVAAAVCLRTHSFKNRIDDSKKLTPRQRETAYPEILAKSFFSVAAIDEKVIDRVNILRATRMAMEEAIRSLCKKLGLESASRVHVLVDGMMKLSVDLPVTEIVHGDARSLSIAAASIVAKVRRDRMMCLFHQMYPRYGFSRHKGYGTHAHRQAIRHWGPCAIHRNTFHCD